jgi:hypothetical protein
VVVLGLDEETRAMLDRASQLVIGLKARKVFVNREASYMAKDYLIQSGLRISQVRANGSPEPVGNAEHFIAQLVDQYLEANAFTVYVVSAPCRITSVVSTIKKLAKDIKLDAKICDATTRRGFKTGG